MRRTPTKSLKKKFALLSSASKIMERICRKVYGRLELFFKILWVSYLGNEESAEYFSVPCCQAVSAVCNISDGSSRLRVASERHTQQYMVLKVFSPRSLACRAKEEGSGESMHEDTSSTSFFLRVPVQHLPFCAILCIISLPSDS